MKPVFILSFLSLAVLATAELEQYEVERAFQNADNRFTADVFNEVAKINTDKSFVVSPFSALTPLAQLSLVSRENTRDQIRDVIGMYYDENIKQSFTLVNERVKSIKGVTLKSASKIYLALNYDVYEVFGEWTWKAFDAAAQNIDFEKNEEAANEINAWVAQSTSNGITNIVRPDSFNGNTRGILVNAIYFKGSWENQFDKQATSEKDFHINKAETKKVEMMYTRGIYKYAESAVLKSQIIEIPYEGRQVSLIVVLPHDIEGIKDVQEAIKDRAVLDNAINHLRRQEVDLYLPKFKVETTTDLKNILQKLNVTDVFDNNARLDYLIRVRGHIFIESAIQKAYIEVDEEGKSPTPNLFEDIVGTLTHIPRSTRSLVFNADRPFYFVLKMGSFPVCTGVMYA